MALLTVRLGPPAAARAGRARRLGGRGGGLHARGAGAAARRLGRAETAQGEDEPGGKEKGTEHGGEFLSADMTCEMVGTAGEIRDHAR
jgi:hypothetical protein